MTNATAWLRVIVALYGTLLWVVPTGAQLRPSQQEDGDRLPQLIGELYSKDHDSNAIRSKLLTLARHSRRLRAEVIRALIAVLEDAFNIHEKALFKAWYDAADVIGELRATQALDVLIKYLDFTSGDFSLSVDTRPAVKALVQIGKPAVPKLIAALSTANRSSVRADAAEALGRIGSLKARQALERALKTEQDKDVIGQIKWALYISRHGPVPIKR
jgi:HEAT repeat protein